MAYSTHKLVQKAGHSRLKVSLSPSTLLSGAAGFLDGKKIATDSSFFELLAKCCSTVVRVDEGDVITSVGMSPA